MEMYMKSQLRALPRRPILFINRKSRPDLYFKAGCVDPEKYHIEVKELVPYVGDKHFNFRVHDGTAEYEGAVNVHKLYMVWPEGRERRTAKITARRA
jgi:hypothetical protein